MNKRQISKFFSHTLRIYYENYGFNAESTQVFIDVFREAMKAQGIGVDITVNFDDKPE